MPARTALFEERTSYTVTYDSKNHWQILFQMHGSMWPRVLPYCIANVIWMIVLTTLNEHVFGKNFFRLEMTQEGHHYLSLVMAFTLVSRVTMALERYDHARHSLDIMISGARNLIVTVCETTRRDQSQKAKEWRNKVVYEVLVLLRSCMAVMDYPVDKIPAWSVPELCGEEKSEIDRTIRRPFELRSLSQMTSFTNLNSGFRRTGLSTVSKVSKDSVTDLHRNEWEETMRVPIRLAAILHRTLDEHVEVLQVRKFSAPMEVKIFRFVEDYMEGYYGMRKFYTTPVPFPFVQMGRTFLFLYVFTVPFVLLSDGSTLPAHCFAIFLLTYGYVGLEMSAIELDNPFGDGENSFDNNGMAHTVYEDGILTMLEVDGTEWMHKLRKRMSSNGDAKGMSSHGGRKRKSRTNIDYGAPHEETMLTAWTLTQAFEEYDSDADDDNSLL